MRVRIARRSAIGFGIAALVLGSWAGTAYAHAFLVSSTPSPGARLETAPTVVTLQFTEAVDVKGSEVTLTVLGKERALPLSLRVGGASLHAAVPYGGTGIFVVAWKVTSADDGHVTSGSFAFAVGDVSGTIPSPTTHSPAPDGVLVIANWAVFAGIALGAGGLVADLMIDPASPRRRKGFISAGLLIALAGALIVFLQSTGPDAGTAPVRVGDLTLATSILFACAQAVRVSERLRWLALALVSGGAVVWAGLGHGAAEAGALGWLIAGLHLLAAALWVGCLFYLVLHAFGAKRSRTDVWPTTLRYARVALWSVAVIAASGVYLAVALLPTLADLWESSYGQLIVVKSALLMAAVCLALVSRTRGVGRRAVQTVRLATRIELGLLVGALIVASLLIEVGPPAPALPIADLLGPTTLSGPTINTAGLAGTLTVGVSANGRRLLLEVYEGAGQSVGTVVRARAIFGLGKPVTVALTSCGPGCDEGPLTLPRGRTRLLVNASSPGWVPGVLAISLVWPPTPLDPILLTRLIAKMRTVPTLQLTEQVRSGRYHTTPKVFSLTGGQFMNDEVYAEGLPDKDEGAAAASDVRALPGGDPGFSFDLGQAHLWVTIWLDTQGRIARERLVNAGNEIDRSFSYGGSV